MTAQPETGFTDWRVFEPLRYDPILEHALEAFSENGFHGTTVRDLARRVGVTVPALYYHHENKEAVLVTLLDAAVLDLIDRVLAAVADGGADPAARFANAVEAIVLNMTYRAKRSGLDSELRHVSFENRRTYAATRKRLELIMLDLVRDGTEAGVFDVDDAEETVRAMLGMLQSIARWYQIDGPLTPAQVADRYIVIALRIVGYHTTN
ncbi:TetR/AcrR family transcriptional regulator [Rhodococcus sp. HNM0563]|uniref:TetR/AcrR family transcriptional regulator n=1 Tax=Rhodococcus sp. HNM0563 TaxID=2716339 RepID=UPI00146D868A|nr:TetR/AcrR family transcriptional regulator [Rhodococcus sp. HNM0563]NLU63836.1 TetR/AcrR family transcriptional regulator [Rhodococcus sp. HNM0563]